jgi:hypothetical protein
MTAAYGLLRTNRRAPSFNLPCLPAARLRVLHEESNPTTARLVHASDVDETIAPISIGSIGAENVYSFVLAELGFLPTHASARDTSALPPNAMPRPERRSAGLKSMKASSCAAFGLAVKPPAESATARSGPCCAKAQSSGRGREATRCDSGHHVRSWPILLKKYAVQNQRKLKSIATPLILREPERRLVGEVHGRADVVVTISASDRMRQTRPVFSRARVLVSAFCQSSVCRRG